MAAEVAARSGASHLVSILVDEGGGIHVDGVGAVLSGTASSLQSTMASPENVLNDTIMALGLIDLLLLRPDGVRLHVVLPAQPVLQRPQLLHASAVPGPRRPGAHRRLHPNGGGQLLSRVRQRFGGLRVGLVFIPGIGVLALGAVVMLVTYRLHPGFFR